MTEVMRPAIPVTTAEIEATEAQRAQLQELPPKKPPAPSVKKRGVPDTGLRSARAKEQWEKRRKEQREKRRAADPTLWRGEGTPDHHRTGLLTKAEAVELAKLIADHPVLRKVL